MLSFVWRPKRSRATFMCVCKLSKQPGQVAGHFFDQFGSHSKWSSREQHEWIFIVTPLKKRTEVCSAHAVVCYLDFTHTCLPTNQSFEAWVCIFNEAGSPNHSSVVCKLQHLNGAHNQSRASDAMVRVKHTFSFEFEFQILSRFNRGTKASLQ